MPELRTVFFDDQWTSAQVLRRHCASGQPHDLPAVLRKHHQRGKISDELRQAALKLAEEYRDKALLDNDYAEHGYALDMEQEHLYGEARKRVREKEGG